MFGKQRKSLPGLLGDLKTTTIDYAKQETLDPIKNLGKFVAYGFVGSILLGFGLILWVIAALRVLQTETGSAFDGNWNFVPYVITFFACILVAGFAFYAIKGDQRRAKKRKEQAGLKADA